MRCANVSERLALVGPDGTIDVERRSGGLFGSDPQAVYERWQEFASWAAEQGGADEPMPDTSLLGPPSPRPRQVFAIGLNYSDHAEEVGRELPESPMVFTKFPTCLTGANAEVEVATEKVDWEVELVVVIGRLAHRVSARDAWSHVAGLTVGQDLSARDVQSIGSPAQFSLGKSFPGFGPIGPWLVSPDELGDRDDLAIACTLNGETVQSSRTSRLIFPVADLIARLSAVCPLLPGDLIFTGTPSGVGVARRPRRYLAAGDVLVSTIEGIGSITTKLV